MPLLEGLTTAGDGNGGTVATTVLVIGEGAALFAAFCPSWFTVRSPFFHDQAAKDGNIRAIRQGEAAGAAITIAVGAAGAAMVGSTLPLYGAVAVSAVMILGYEWSIQHPSAEYTDDTDPTGPVRQAFRWRQQ